MKHSLVEMNTALLNIQLHFWLSEENISELEDKSIEIIQSRNRNRRIKKN